MQSDLGRQIGELMERGVRPVSFEEVSERSVAAESAARPRARRRRMAIGGVAAGIAAAGCAAALLIATASPGAPAHPAVAARPGAAVHPGGSPSGGPVILTAAMVQRVAAASQSALASSGREQITYQNRKNGTVDGHGDDVITFSGGNYNWAIDELVPPSASPRLPAMEVAGITRFVNGVAYLQIDVTDPKSPWLRATKWSGPGYFPVPKTALQLLSPRAKFQDLGWQVIGGVRLEHLRATQLSGLPGSLTFAGYRQPGEALSALDLWVDASGVLHQMQLELKSSDSSTTMTVAFSQFGQPETITAPASWIKSGI
jgi:hypothetical protein